MNILPQITQITQRGMQQAALYRRERQFCVGSVVVDVLLLWVSSGIVIVVLSASSARSAGDILGFRLCNIA